MAAMTVYWSQILRVCDSKGGRKVDETPFCRYLRAFDAFMICLQAVEFNSFLLQSDHKRIIRNQADTM